MQYLIFLAAALILILFPPIAAAQEIQFSTYQELARVVTDMQTGNTSALITLQSGSPNDIILPENLRDLVIDDSIINLQNFNGSQSIIKIPRCFKLCNTQQSYWKQRLSMICHVRPVYNYLH